MKNNIDFYQHYANSDQHPKFKMLRTQYNWEGEGRFWALNNRIALAENCVLDLSKKYNKSAIASDLGMNIKEFDEYIQFLINDCELVEEVEPNKITTDIIRENHAKVTIERVKARERATRRWAKQRKASPEKDNSSPEKVCKVKESKVKESKEKKKIKKKFTPPTQKEVTKYFLENGYSNESSIKAFNYYDSAKWKDARGNQVKSWKQKMIGVWFKDENKSKPDNHNNFGEKDYGKSTSLSEVSWAK